MLGGELRDGVAEAFAFPLAPWWFGVELLLVPVWAFWTAVAIARSPAFSPEGCEPAGTSSRASAPRTAVGPAGAAS